MRQLLSEPAVSIFACLHAPDPDNVEQQLLIDCAYAFSPNVEDTERGTVVADVRGTALLFGPVSDLPDRMCSRAAEMGFSPRAAVARDPDAAIHAARGFRQNTVVPAGKETEFLGPLPLKALCPALAGVDEDRAREILETLELWGVRTFGALAALPEAGVSERLGPEGVLLQKLARGQTGRLLGFHRPPPGHTMSADLECPVQLLETLLFTLARLINQLIANLRECSLAAAHMLIRLRLEPGTIMEYPIRLAVPTQDHRLLLKLAEVEIQARPPGAAVCAATVSCEPAKPKGMQKGLFASNAPEPQKIAMQLARIARIAGKDNVGTPELLDTHHPQPYRMRPFEAFGRRGRKASALLAKTKLSLRIFRPSPRAHVRTENGFPVHISSPGTKTRAKIRGPILAAAGPWLRSGGWWSDAEWERHEWDVELAGGAVFRIYFEPAGSSWYVEGVYD